MCGKAKFKPPRHKIIMIGIQPPQGL